MNLITNDAFIEESAEVYFNQSTRLGTPFYLVYTFEQFLKMRARG